MGIVQDPINVPAMVDILVLIALHVCNLQFGYTVYVSHKYLPVGKSKPLHLIQVNLFKFKEAWPGREVIFFSNFTQLHYHCLQSFF